MFPSKKAPCRSLFVLLIGLSMLVLPAYAQLGRPGFDQGYTISGRIIFGNVGAPDERIEVRLIYNGAELLASTYSDGAGNFEFRNLQPATYTVAIDYPGYESVRETVQIAFLGGAARVTTVGIMMNRSTDIRLRNEGGLPGEDPDVVDITEMQRNYPKKAVDEYKKAVDEHRKGDTEKAMKRLEDVLKLAPDFYLVHNSLGMIYQEVHRYRDAETEYRTAHDLNPRSPQPFVNLGRLFIQESDSRREEGFKVAGKLLDDAMDALDEAIRLRPTDAAAHYFLGTAYYKSNFLDDAEGSLKRALDLAPRMGEVRLMLVNVYMRAERWPDVLTQLDAYLKDNPKAQNRASVEEMRAKVAKGLETGGK